MRPAIGDRANPIFGALLLVTALTGFVSGSLFAYWCVSWTDQSGSLLEMLGVFFVLQTSGVMLFAGMHLLAKRRPA